MKKHYFLFLLLIISVAHGQNVGIGTATPNSSAILDLNSISKGFLPPRMTYQQRNSIVSPVPGLIVYCIDCDEVQFYNGVVWKNINGEAASLPIGYPTITICNQTWMGKSLSLSNYRNGDPIPQVTDVSIWGSITVGAWCWYNNDSTTYSAYGKLYNGYAVNDPRGLAPVGWHIPTDAEWQSLSNCLGGNTVAGAALKEGDTTHWASPNTSASNRSGFTALPGGSRSTNGTFAQLRFFNFGWSSTINSGFNNCIYLTFNSASFGFHSRLPKTGLQVRCVRD